MVNPLARKARYSGPFHISSKLLSLRFPRGAGHDPQGLTLPLKLMWEWNHPV